MKQSEIFRKLADKIDRNEEEEFGGAVCIVPPKGEATIDWVIVDSKADLLRFWVKLKTDIDAIAQEVDNRARMQQTWQQR
jgi:hypothetical protein